MNTIKFPRSRSVTLLGLIAFAFVGGVLVQRTEAQSTSEMRASAAESYKNVDIRMNKIYQKILNTDSITAAKIRASQRAWITFRDAEAKYKCTDSEGGSMYPIDYNYALISLTDLRFQKLRKTPANKVGNIIYNHPSVSAADYKKIDNELNVVYQKIIKSSDSRSAANLRAAQRAWITFRDADAKFDCRLSGGGSVDANSNNYALTTLTKQRIQQLRGSTSR